MDLAVVGAGHVGAVCAASLAAIGHRVEVVDVDAERIALLRAGRSPFVEPGIGELLERGRALELLAFHVDPADALPRATLIFLCVNTDNGPDGSVDLSAVESAVRTAARVAKDGAVLVNRSTAPVGTAQYIRSLVEELRGDSVRVAVNPEFLAEGTAVHDFLEPDRILVGAWEREPVSLLAEAYGPIVARRLPSELYGMIGNGHRPAGEVPFVVADPASAELAKYASNSLLAVRVSFINEIAGIAEELGADITKVANAVGLDPRIGPHFLRAGIGWGGSCFPKDIVALQGIAETRGLSARCSEPRTRSTPINACGRSVSSSHTSGRCSGGGWGCWGSASNRTPTTSATLRPWRSRPSSRAPTCRCGPSIRPSRPCRWGSWTRSTCWTTRSPLPPAPMPWCW